MARGDRSGTAGWGCGAFDTGSVGLQDNDEPVIRALDVGLGPAADHVGAHVSENDSPAVEPLPILTEGLVVEVVLDLLLEEVRLADEEVSPACGVDQRVRPFRIARVADYLPTVLGPVVAGVLTIAAR